VGAWDAAGAALFAAGFLTEAAADAQLARFRADPANRGKILDRGLWRFSRHPNYFGDALLWWGLWLLAVGAGAAWTVAGPVLMTFLLVKVSGVALLERSLSERRPGYADYVRRTSAFVPWFPRDRRNPR
jgi:steroid 5-alpha reductase family enzyme